MFSKMLNRIPLAAVFLFIMVSLAVNHCTTYGQTPTPLPVLSPIPEPTPPATGVVVGTVVNSNDGTGILNATVTTGTGISTETDSNGSFVLELSPGDYLLTASATGFISSSQPVVVIAGTLTPADFSLQPTATGGNSIIVGFVEDENGDPLKGVAVTLDGTTDSDSTETDEEGFFQFSNLSAGDYTLTCEKDGYQTYTESINLVENDVQVLGTIVLEAVVKATLTGYVVNIRGDSIENVKIKVKGLKTGYSSTTSTDADGFFELTDLDADTYVIVAKKKGYKRAPQTIKLGDGESQEIEIELKKTSKRIIKTSAP